MVLPFLYILPHRSFSPFCLWHKSSLELIWAVAISSQLFSLCLISSPLNLSFMIPPFKNYFPGLSSAALLSTVSPGHIESPTLRRLKELAIKVTSMKKSKKKKTPTIFLIQCSPNTSAEPRKSFTNNPQCRLITWPSFYLILPPPHPQIHIYLENISAVATLHLSLFPMHFIASLSLLRQFPLPTSCLPRILWFQMLHLP